MSQLKIKNGDSWVSIPAGGVGIPVGGSGGQILQKVSDVNYHTQWTTLATTSGLPADLGEASLGSSQYFAPLDHVHTKPSCEDIGAMPTYELLWVNAAPTVAFASQTLVTDLSPYDGLMVEIACTTATNLPHNLNFVLKDFYSSVSAKNSTSNGLYGRDVYMREEGIFMNNGYANGTKGDANAIPIRIWGIKNVTMALPTEGD